jgi:hypothetical protein
MTDEAVLKAPKAASPVVAAAKAHAAGPPAMLAACNAYSALTACSLVMRAFTITVIAFST